jgi:MSHA pilin protein MshC
MTRRFDHRGFTQVELIVVIAIAGLLAAVAIPRFVNPRDFRELGFHDEMLSAARYAQKFAIATGCEVQFSVSGGAYALNQRATNCTTGAFTRIVVDPGTLDTTTTFSGTAPSDVSVSMTASPVVFDALGKTADGVTRTVTVGSKTFQIIGATGYAHTP